MKVTTRETEPGGHAMGKLCLRGVGWIVVRPSVRETMHVVRRLLVHT